MSAVTKIDGYKLDHRRQFPVKTTRVLSNWTPRGSRVPGTTHVVFFGLQYFLKKYMQKDFEKFFDSSKDAALNKFKRRVDGYLGPNTVGVDHIAQLYELGYVPLEFKALKEGTRTPLRVPMLTVENTHDDFGWMTNYVESLMSCTIWMPCTSATTAMYMRSMLERHAEITGGEKSFVDWQSHDFSFRGMSSLEAACTSGAGHLIFFKGTDTMPALDFIEEYYGPLPDPYLLGGSVAATEHSVMCAGGEDSELDTLNRLLDLYPTGIVSVVSDTWDLWNLITVVLPQLKGRIMAREGKLVIRPDSGDPVKIMCGDTSKSPNTPAYKGVVELLWDVFGGTYNSKGYKQLDSHIGSIYGDAINYSRADEISFKLSNKGFSSTNVVFGTGSFTYQFVTRDTNGFAMKGTWCRINGEGKDLFKKPVTDDGEKHSAKGRLAVLKNVTTNKLELVQQATPEQEEKSELKQVFIDGQFKRTQNFEEIRQVANS